MCYILTDLDLERGGHRPLGDSWDPVPKIPAKDPTREESPDYTLAQGKALPKAAPFAIFGPRIGVQSISDVLPGQMGRRVTIADLKLGLKRG